MFRVFDMQCGNKYECLTLTFLRNFKLISFPDDKCYTIYATCLALEYYATLYE